MKGDTDFCKKHFQILSTQVCLRCISPFFQNFTAGDTGLRVDAGKRQVIIPRFEVCLLLLCKLTRHPREDRCPPVPRIGKHMKQS